MFPFNLHQVHVRKRVSFYFKLLCKISEAHQNRTGTSVFCSVKRATFILSVSLARADRYVLHFSLALPFLPRTTRVDVPVFLLPLASSFCSSSFLLTDYAPVDVHRHRLPRFASSHFPLLFVSFSFLQRNGSKYILSLLQRSSISISRLTQKSVCFSNLPSFSIHFSARFNLRSLFPIRAPPFPIPYKPLSVSFHSSRILLLSVYTVTQNFCFNNVILEQIFGVDILIIALFNIRC